MEWAGVYVLIAVVAAFENRMRAGDAKRKAINEMLRRMAR